MNSQPSTDQRSSTAGAAAPSPPPPAPGPGAPSAEAMQRLVDQAAHFNMFSLPDRSVSGPNIMAPGDASSVIGWKIHEVLHRDSCSGENRSAPHNLRIGVKYFGQVELNHA